MRLGSNGSSVAVDASIRRRLSEMIRDTVSPVERRVRGRVIVELAEDLARTKVTLGVGFARDNGVGPLDFLTLAAAHLPACRVAYRDAVVGFESFAQAHAAAQTDQARREAIRDRLVATVRVQRQLRGDLAAVSRDLDFDALRERHAQQLHAANVRDELLMSAVARTLERYEEPQGDRGALASMVADTRLDSVLAQQAQLPTGWRIRLAALNALGRLAHALAAHGLADAVDPQITRLAINVAQQASHHPWTQAAALDILFDVAPATAEALAIKRVLGRSSDAAAHDFVTRRLFVDRLLVRVPASRADILFTAMSREVDPSEHVQLGLCEHAATLRTQAALEFLRGRAVDGSWRVRASVGRALCTALRSTLEDELDTEAPPLVHEILAQQLANESDARTLGPLLAEVRLLFEAPRDPAHARRLRPDEVGASLLPRLACVALPPPMHESIAATLEVLDRAASSSLRAAHATLSMVVEQTPVGRSRALGLPPALANPGPEELGRTLAQITREGFGVELAGPRNHRLFRGDHFALRGWRILHELTHPTPNKRAAHPHLVGRRRRGLLRAHSGLLDEVTVTVVPGERLRSEYEGGWGRHLPLVDDVLDLPVLVRRDVSLFSSHGVTRVRPAAGLLRRVWARLAITVRYAQLAALRRESLDAREPEARARYTQTLRDRYCIDVQFTPYGRPGAPGELVESPHVRAHFASLGSALPALPALPAVEDSLRVQADYLASMSGNGQVALALFVFAIIAALLVGAFGKQRAMRRARKQIPLCIGGWGTRGKSGTERLKAALFSGLGYDVYSKTTGCEAMMLHSSEGEIPTEVFLFRPYDKATIWEHSTTLKQATTLGTEVFLWECMALNPRYVELLQLQWMRDDLSTITNTYPDHEDIQGPAGSDVAEVIAKFIPSRSKVISAEINFAPVLREVAAQRGTAFTSLDAHEESYLAEDFLALFPYAEHPRNIALVRRVAVELGIDPELATYVMAQSVVPDIGVLKRFGPVQVAGRTLTFISGQSANERTGFMNNWRRMGCDTFDAERDPGQFVMTVVNNRADRVSRSVVFAKILVDDIAADRHVLIGTNTSGLVAYIGDALDERLGHLDIVREHELERPEALESCKKRLAAQLARLRVPAPTTEVLLRRLSSWMTRLGMAATVDELQPLRSAVERWLARSSDPQPVDALRAALAADAEITAGFQRLRPGSAMLEPPETYSPPSPSELHEHFCRDAARVLVHAALLRQLERACRRELTAQQFHRQVADAYRGLFMDSLDVVTDIHASGDSIVLRCARAVPPGADAILMGSQNIKGTGLDFAYRWLALESVERARREIRSDDPVRVADGLRMLEAQEDLGSMGAGLAKATLITLRERRSAAVEGARLEPLLERIERVHHERIQALATARGSSRMDTVLGWLEQSIDFLDAVGRQRRAHRVMNDLGAGRISHGRAAVVMRELTSRQKGGWLAKTIRGWLKPDDGQAGSPPTPRPSSPA